MKEFVCSSQLNKHLGLLAGLIGDVNCLLIYVARIYMSTMYLFLFGSDDVYHTWMLTPMISTKDSEKRINMAATIYHKCYGASCFESYKPNTVNSQISYNGNKEGITCCDRNESGN